MTGEHRGEELKGRLEEAAGTLTNDSDLQQKGREDQTAAKVKRGVDKAADKLHDAVDAVTDRQ